ncbi:M61 family metallopeptidase [uncultured Psychrobacter sp.]|uniref:M61 family metallopeptidase n=1 Tax=uncultured Psychrobacter sp. TaxID=259303 RepID=UPI00345AF1B2
MISNSTIPNHEQADNHKNVNNVSTTVINYRLDFARFNEHLVDVTLSFTADNDMPSLWLPAWIPGSYLMREFARNITAVYYQIIDDDSGGDKSGTETTESYRAFKQDKNTWQLTEAQAGQTLSVHYEVYCYDLSVRTAYVDQQRLYGNFTSLTLAVEGQEHLPAQVSLLVPAAFMADKNSDEVKLACGLEATHLQVDTQESKNPHGYGLQADNYYELIDHPFEIAVQQSFDFIIQDEAHQTLSHRFFISGKHSANMGRLQQNITQICQAYLNWLGSAPFSDYTFMTYASGQDYGGLEHINSTSLITPRRDLPSHDEPELPSTDYQRFLGLCSHEYFHAWWVKTVRPDVMLQVDLRREAYTPMLWVFEGFTSYVDDFMLQASGVIDKPSYLKLLAEQISRYYQTPGRAYQSVAESSFDAWIKLYRSDENTGNAGISYYNKGALVALCLDLILLQNSNGRHRLFDVVKTFYQRAKQQDNKRIGISSADMGAVVSEFMPKADWEDFERRYINGVDELPIEQLLTANGIEIETDSEETADNKTPWGMRYTETAAGLKITRVQRSSPAALAGISANDLIIAIDGIKADSKQLEAFSPVTKGVSCHLFRRDELLTVTVTSESADKKDTPAPYKIHLKLADDDNVSDRDKAYRWLNALSH